MSELSKEQLEAYRDLALAQIEYEKPDVPDELYQNLGEVTLALMEVQYEHDR